jgi:DNA-binding PadR family transcriptional regulator
MVDLAGTSGIGYAHGRSAPSGERASPAFPVRQIYVLRCYVLRSIFDSMRTGGLNGVSRTPPSRRRSNDPPILILMSLAGGAKHGHALLKDIEVFAGVKLGPGALYGAITRLEERGLIEPLESDDRRRPYRLTAAGSEALAESLAQMRDLVRVGEARLKSAPTPRPRMA